jgi:hypothetical protein
MTIGVHAASGNAGTDCARNVSATMRRRLEMQGFVGYTSCELAEFGPWLRLTTGICAAWTAVATVSGAAGVFWALVPVAVMGVVLPNHPFDAIYNYGLRRRLATRSIPRYGAPRRFACVVASIWLLFTGFAFFVGMPAVGHVLGASMALAAFVPTATDFCIPSFVYQLVAQTRRRGV